MRLQRFVRERLVSYPIDREDQGTLTLSLCHIESLRHEGEQPLPLWPAPVKKKDQAPEAIAADHAAFVGLLAAPSVGIETEIAFLYPASGYTDELHAV